MQLKKALIAGSVASFLLVSSFSFFTLAAFFLSEGPCFSFSRNGPIDSRFSYKDLKISGSYLKGKIVNRTAHLQEDILIEFFTRDYFGKYVWTAVVSISVIGPNGSKSFSSYIPSDPGKLPKFRIKVLRPKNKKRPEQKTETSAISSESSKGEIHIKIRGLKTKIWGEGQQTSKTFFLANTLYKFKFTHSGDGHFSIWLMNKKGRQELIANDIGRFSGSKGTKIKKIGLFFVNIQADSDARWTINIEPLDGFKKHKTRNKTTGTTSKPMQNKLHIWKDENGVTHISESPKPE